MFKQEERSFLQKKRIAKQKWALYFWMGTTLVNEHGQWFMNDYISFVIHLTLFFGMNELDDLETLLCKSWVNDKVYNLYQDVVICKWLTLCFTFRCTALLKVKLKMCKIKFCYNITNTKNDNLFVIYWIRADSRDCGAQGRKMQEALPVYFNLSLIRNYAIPRYQF